MNSSPFTRGPNKGRGIPQDWRRGSHQYRDGGVRGGASRGRGEEREIPAPTPMARGNKFQQRPIHFGLLMKLAEETTDLPMIVQKLGQSDGGLRKLLEDHSSDSDILELVLVIIGNFCKENGAALFANAFITMMQTLGEKDIFRQISSVILRIPNSRSTNLPSKNERLKKLLASVYYLTSELIVRMPAFACNFLGEDFFVEFKSLENIYSVKALNVGSSFEILDEGIVRLKNVWEQQSRSKENAKTGRNEQMRLNLAALNEIRAMAQPPDDFRQLNITPQWEDVCMDIEPFLRRNIIQGSYPDVDSYLDTQFRLLREDFYYPLRSGLLGFKNRMRETKNKHTRIARIDNVRFYYDVEISEHKTTERDQSLLKYLLKFSTKGLERIQWETSKRLMNRSLLCLSSDGFSSFHLFTISDRLPSMLSEGKIVATLEGSNSLSAELKRDVYTMAESSVYFEAYRSILSTLQKINHIHFPMEEYILGKSVDPQLPLYLRANEKEVRYDLTDLMLSSDDKTETSEGDASVLSFPLSFRRPADLPLLARRNLLSQVAISDPYTRPGSQALGLDPSQTEALYAALTRKLAIIQGPPGTGKTFLGLKIIQVLLTNKQFWKTDVTRVGQRKPSPILVICYTNHALDQFLEGILKFTKQIVRIGGNSKCEALQPFTLSQWKRRSCHHKHRSLYYEARNQLFESKSILDARKAVMKNAEASGIVHEDSLFHLKIMPEMMHNKFCDLKKKFGRFTMNGSIIPFWLGVVNEHYLKRLPAKTSAALNLFKQLKETREQPVTTTNATNAESLAEDGDDQWDKEDIDAILEQRGVEEEEDVDLLEPPEKTVTVSPSHLADVIFGLEFSKLIEEKKEYEEQLTKAMEEQLTKEIEEENQNSLKCSIDRICLQLNYVEKLLKQVPAFDREQDLTLVNWCKDADLSQIPHHLRWRMYITWVNELVDVLNKEICGLETNCRFHFENLKEIEILESSEVCGNADIIGVTTTGAANHRALLGHLNSKIVVIEEAAEVLEAHIITSLSTSCQHLILIGDHMQLRPPTTVYRLAKDYHLDVSLFERLVKNGMEPCVLSVQHRMRPEVAGLIVPSIYPTLENHSSVLEYPNILGMEENVFFLEHTEREKEDREGKSHLNPYEADMALALVRHLMMQGYDASQITVLTTYSGQLLYLKKARRNQFSLNSVRISVVDNFQGEENDIIILSLVRSNEEEKIGFLRIENRICVALSRAKKGFYLIGNMNALQGKSKLWNTISQVLSSNKQQGPHFGLKCEIHGIITEAQHPSSFPPEGGCFLKCSASMPCGHVCLKICHSSDREHVKQKCEEACTRSCPEGHRCPKKCFKDCHPCMEPVSKILPCRHSKITKCGNDPAEEFCSTIVWKDFPTCEHRIEIACSTPIKEVKCPEICGMTLDCLHECNLICHNPRSHDKIPCRQSCRRSPCLENHPCPRECFADCGNCLQQVSKNLPCGHNAEVECYVLPKDVYCTEKIEKILSKCQHSGMFECSKSTVDYICRQTCNRPLCLDGHLCNKPCSKPCGPCNVHVERELSCGHKNLMKCHVDPPTFKCPYPVKSVHPFCNHTVEMACGDKPEDVKCKFPCKVRLDCGHACTQKCHPKNDPEHEKYGCKKACEKLKLGCKKNHRCGNRCYEDCDPVPCNIKWTRSLPCGHKAFAECHFNDEDIHCSIKVSRTILECGHKFVGDCSKIPKKKDCIESCDKILPCEHRCTKKCSETCDPNQCEELVTLNTEFGLCGHQLVLPCQEYRSYSNQFGILVPNSLKEKFLGYCTKPCASSLKPCDHQCQGTCGECFNGRLHKACQEKCGRTLVCGHLCDVNCTSTCPPCKKKCDYHCRHSKCARICSKPCSPCKELCGWRCEHFSCSLKCSEKCDRPRCDEPCKKKLPCGHPCVGLCGEQCPPLCGVCHRSQLTEFVLYGNEEDDDAKFVYLPDCGHSIEVEGLDYWMDMKDDDVKKEIQMKCCPRCKTIIRDCYRYGNVIKSNMHDVVLVKNKLTSTRVKPQVFAETLQVKIREASSLNDSFASQVSHPITSLIRSNLVEINSHLIPRKKGKILEFKTIDPDHKYTMEVQLDVTERILELIQKSLTGSTKSGHKVLMKTPLLHDILSRALRIFNSVHQRELISSEDFQDVVTEMERLSLFRMFFLLQSVPNFNQISSTNPEKVRIEQLLMFNVQKLGNSVKAEIKSNMELIGERLSTGLGIDDEERKQIVKAMGMGQGHWFKCPNGHIYAIGNCGQAVMESVCNECKAPIGGGSQLLRSDNRRAGEMN